MIAWLKDLTNEEGLKEFILFSLKKGGLEESSHSPPVNKR